MPDPRGVVGFALAAGVLFFHLTLPFDGRSYLWSENPMAIEAVQPPCLDGSSR